MNDRKSHAWAEAELEKLNAALLENGCPKALFIFEAAIIGEKNNALMIDWSELPDAYQEMLIDWSMQVQPALYLVGGSTRCCGFTADNSDSLRLALQALNKVVTAYPKGARGPQQAGGAKQA